MSGFKIFLNTKDRNYGSIGSPSFNIVNSITDTANQFDIYLESIVFANSIYPVNSKNNCLYIKLNGGATQTLTIASNSYTGTTLASYLATNLTSLLGISVTCSYSDVTKKVTLTAAIPNTIKIIASGTSSIHKNLGFTSDTADAAGLTSTYPIDISGSAYLDMSLNSYSKELHSGGLSNILHRIPLTAPFGSLNYYVNNNAADLIRVSHDWIYRINFTLYEPDGSIADFPLNTDISVVLVCVPIGN